MASYSSKNESMPEGYSRFAINQYTPEQSRLFKSSMKRIGKGSYLDRLATGDDSAYDEMEAPAMQQMGGLQSGLNSRFGGGSGGMKSGPFRNQASSDFAMSLKAGRHGLRQQAIMDLMGMSNQMLQQRPQERGLIEAGQEHYGSLDDFASDYKSNKRKWG